MAETTVRRRSVTSPVRPTDRKNAAAALQRSLDRRDNGGRPATSRAARPPAPRGPHAASGMRTCDVTRWDEEYGARMSRSLNLAVIPGDGIGQEVVAEGLKVLSAVLPQDVKLETKEYDFGAQRYHATGETLTDADLDALKEHDAILLGAIGDPSRALRRAGARLPAQAALRLRPPRQPAPVEALPGRRPPRWPAARRSTSSSSARAPRARTPATAARSARAPRTRSPPRSPSTRPSASSAWSATPSPAPRPARARSSRWSTRTTCWPSPATCGRTDLRPGRPRSSPRSPPTTCTSTRRRSSWSPSPSGST